MHHIKNINTKKNSFFKHFLLAHLNFYWCTYERSVHSSDFKTDPDTSVHDGKLSQRSQATSFYLGKTLLNANLAFFLFRS